MALMLKNRYIGCFFRNLLLKKRRLNRNQVLEFRVSRLQIETALKH